MLAPVVLLIVVSVAARDQTVCGAGLLYWTTAALVGASLSLVVLSYSGPAPVSTFLITAGAFAGLSLWGYFTKRNLGAVGSFLTVALFGLITATIANARLGSTMLDVLLNVGGVAIFAGL